MEDLLEYLSRDKILQHNSKYYISNNFDSVRTISDSPEYYILSDEEGIMNLIPQLEKIKILDRDVDKDKDFSSVSGYHNVGDLVRDRIDHNSNYYNLTIHYWTESSSKKWNPHICYSLMSTKYLPWTQDKVLCGVDVEKLNREYTKKIKDVMEPLYKWARDLQLI